MTQEKLVRWQDRLPDGFKKLPPDHPIYSEGPSITFLRRTPGQSQQKDIVFPQTDSPSDSDSPTQKEVHSKTFSQYL